MRRAHDREVAAIERRDGRDPESLRGDDDGGINGPERQIFIRDDELGDPDPVRGIDGFGDEGAGREVSEEPCLGVRTQSLLDEVGDLRDDEMRNDERTGMRREQFEACVVVPVVLVDVGVQRTGVDQERYRFAPRRRISSIFSDVSV